VTVTDISPNTNNGTLTAQGGFENVDNIKAFTSSGSTTHALTATTSLSGSPVMTISAWVKFDSFASTSIIYLLGNSSANNEQVWLGTQSNGSIWTLANGGAGAYNQYSSNDPPILNSWIHVAAIYSGGTYPEGLSLYINGRLLTPTVRNGSGVSLTLPSNSPLYLGFYGSGTEFFDGSIANFRLYSKALNADQVKELYDYQKDYFLGSKSQVTLYKGHLGIGVTEPSGQLELAGDERLQQYPPGPMSDFETYIPEHGVFCAYSSRWSTNSNNPFPWKAFNKETSGSKWWFEHYHNDDYPYGASGVTTGYANSSVLTALGASTNGIAGHWIQLKLPYEIKLKSYALTARTTGLGYRMPENGIIFGSNDGHIWTQIHNHIDTGDAYVSSIGPRHFNVDVSGTYRYFRLATTKLFSNSSAGDTPNIGEIQFFGTPGPTTLDKGSLTLGRSLDVPRISRYDVDTETPRPEKLLFDYDTTVNSSLTDISGQGNHGVLFSDAQYSAVDKAFKFDGTDDYSRTSITIAGGNMAWTQSMWFKVTAFLGSGVYSILSFFGNKSGFSGHIMSYVPGEFWQDWYGGGVKANYTFEVGQWYHVVSVYHGNTSTDANVRSSMYINGVKQTLIWYSQTSTAMTLPTSTNYELADHINSANTRHNGLISNVKFYNVALEPSEAKKLYRLGRTGRSMVISDTAVGIGKVPEAQLDVRGTFKTANMSVDGEAITFYNNNKGGTDNDGDDWCASALLYDYNAWTSIFAKSWIGNSQGWGTFWAGNAGAAYRRVTNDNNPNEYVFVGGGAKRFTFTLDEGQAYFDAGLSQNAYDYAEYFEWEDGNPDNEDRRGYSVVLGENGKIKKATSRNTPTDIIGIISGTPGVVGDAACYDWRGKYELDEWGTKVTDEVYQLTWTTDDKNHSYDEDRIPEGVTVPENGVSRRLYNRRRITPGYDDTKDYIPRDKRKEWSTVGLLGKVRLRDGCPTNPNWRYMKTIAGKELWLIR
jgi:hypothetical protein